MLADPSVTLFLCPTHLEGNRRVLAYCPGMACLRLVDLRRSTIRRLTGQKLPFAGETKIGEERTY